MCYKSPGARCHTHAEQRYEKIRTKAAKNFREHSNIDNEFTAKTNKDPNFINTKEGKALSKKRDVAFVKMRKTSDLVEKARVDIDATKGGIAEIEKKIKEVDVNPTDGAIHKAHLQRRLAIAKKSYRESMDAYDKENGTVDGRSPSTYGSSEGEAILRHRASVIDKKASQTKDPKEVASYKAKADAIAGQIEHSQMTQKAVAGGWVIEEHSSLAVDKLKFKKYSQQYAKYKSFEKQWQTDRKAGISRKSDELRNWRSSDGQSEEEIGYAKADAATRILYNKATPEQVASFKQRISTIGSDYNGSGKWTGE